MTRRRERDPLKIDATGTPERLPSPRPTGSGPTHPYSEKDRRVHGRGQRIVPCVQLRRLHRPLTRGGNSLAALQGAGLPTSGDYVGCATAGTPLRASRAADDPGRPVVRAPRAVPTPEGARAVLRAVGCFRRGLQCQRASWALASYGYELTSRIRPSSRVKSWQTR